MDVSGVSNLISSVGFPVACCIGLAVYCKMLFEKNNEIYNRLFDMCDRGNTENREAIKACTEAINKLCDKLDDKGE